MMKKLLILLSVAVMLFASACSLKVERDVFHIPEGSVEALELQREYIAEDTGYAYYKSKKITDEADVERICEKVRKLPVRRASSSEPHPMTEFSLIVIMEGNKRHHLVLTEKMAFYDQIAYEYTDKQAFSDFVKLYNGLSCEEKETEPDRF